MSMRSFSALPVFLLFLSTGLVAQSPVSPAGQTGQSQPAPASGETGQSSTKSTDPVRAADPLVQREKDIQKYDPLAKQPEDISPDPRYATGTVKGLDTTSSGQQGSDRDFSREYTGPAVLTRSYAVEKPSVPENVKFRIFAGVDAIYDTGLTSVTTRPDGTLENRPSFGTMIKFGLEGRHYWKHDILQLSYFGNYSHYSPVSTYDGSNHVLSFNWTHLIQKRLSVSVTSDVSHYSMNYNLNNPVVNPDIGVANANLATTPNIQIFDNSTTQASNAVHLTWQKTARLSFDFSGSYFFIKRAGAGLLGSDGAQGGNDVSYRVTRKTTLGGYYSYTYYRFSHGAGNTSSHNVGLIYSYAFNSRTELRTRVGVDFLENLGISSVSLDPVIAALLGQSSALVQYYSKNRLLDFSGSLTRQLHGSRSIHAAYTQGMTPGNGVFVASKQQVVDAGFNADFWRKYKTTLSGGRSALSSISQAIGNYNSEYVHFGVSRPINRDISADLGFDFRHFDVSGSPLLRNQYRVSLGVSWSNSDFPSRIF